MFKTKTKKIYEGDTRITLDARHQQMIEKFNQEQKQVIKLRKELSQFENKLKHLKNDTYKKNTFHPEKWQEILELEKRIDEQKESIRKLEQKENEQEYFLKTGDILSQYYSHITSVGTNPLDVTFTKIEQENASKTNAQKMLRQSMPKPKGKRNHSWMENTSTRVSNIMSFFQETPSVHEPEKVSEEVTVISTDNQLPVVAPASNPVVVEQESTSVVKLDEIEESIQFLHPGDDFDRAHALHQYLQEVDPQYIPPRPATWMIEFCPTCLEKDNKKREMIVSHHDGFMVCEICGHLEEVVIDSEKPSYKDPPPEATYFAYKRINHFQEWLNQIQAKESTEIPPEVYQYILEEIRKERITDLALLTRDKIRGYLKKLRLNKYYEHIPHIINKLNGLPPAILTREMEEKLRVMFKEIQGPFLEICPKNRKNFLSYSYVLHKFVELLGMDEYKVLFPLLKSREKLHQQDMMWKQICAKLGWEYIPSI